MIRAVTIALLCSSAELSSEPYVVTVVDDQTGRGVPMVEFESVNGVTFITDSAGVIAMDEPGFNGQATWFNVRSHGYEVPADGFGNRGVRLEVKAGGSATVKIKRLNIAERMYRITGEGIYRDSVIVGVDTPIDKPVSNAGVLGQDSTQAVVYRGKVFWFWGDTNLVGYPLGHFGTAGATSPGPDAIKPDVGIDLTYFVNDKGQSRPTFKMDQPGVIWAHGLFVVPDKDGRDRMLVHWDRRKGLGPRYEHGIAVWNDDAARWDRTVTLPEDASVYPRGHAFRWTPPGSDTAYIYFADPYPTVRVPATYEAAIDPAKYEAVPGANEHKPIDSETGDAIELHRGSIRWNEHRKKWLMIAGRIRGDRSMLGEIYYLESDSPMGPWERAVRIVTHDKYTFYNPVQHGFLDRGKHIYFEGTYTHQFSGTERRTPRYDYNQIMYQLDLDDRRLEK